MPDDPLVMAFRALGAQIQLLVEENEQLRAANEAKDRMLHQAMGNGAGPVDTPNAGDPIGAPTP